jgi:hypothetical protein
MKTILKLLVAAVVINASVRAGMVAMNYYEFKETAHQAVLFGASSSTGEIRERILEKAGELKLPIDPANVTVSRRGPRTWADASYRQPVEFFPNQAYPVSLSFSVEGYQMVLGQ